MALAWAIRDEAVVTRAGRRLAAYAHRDAAAGELGLVLPPPVQPPPGIRLPFTPVRVVGDRALVSGHGPQDPDGSIAGPLGKLGADLTVEQGYQAARLTALSMLGSLAREAGDLDRITAWVRVFGMVKLGPRLREPAGRDQRLLRPGPRAVRRGRRPRAFGRRHGRASPFNLPVEVEAEVRIAP